MPLHQGGGRQPLTGAGCDPIPASFQGFLFGGSSFQPHAMLSWLRGAECARLPVGLIQAHPHQKLSRDCRWLVLHPRARVLLPLHVLMLGPKEMQPLAGSPSSVLFSQECQGSSKLSLASCVSSCREGLKYPSHFRTQVQAGPAGHCLGVGVTGYWVERGCLCMAARQECLLFNIPVTIYSIYIALPCSRMPGCAALSPWGTARSLSPSDMGDPPESWVLLQ